MKFHKKKQKPNVLIEIKFEATEQEIATALETNPRIYKILTSLANSEYLRGIKEGSLNPKKVVEDD